jgi:hypothetical protein
MLASWMLAFQWVTFRRMWSFQPQVARWNAPFPAVTGSDPVVAVFAATLALLLGAKATEGENRVQRIFQG